MNIIYIIGFFLPIFYFFLLISKSHKKVADKLLAVLVLTIGLHLLNYYLHNEGYWDKYPHLVGITVPFPFIYGPLMFLYIEYSAHGSNTFNKKHWFHFTPFGLVVLYMTRFYFFYSLEEKRMVDQGINKDFDSFTSFIYIVFILSVVYYSIRAVILLRWYRKALDDQYSNLKFKDIKWFSNFLKGFGIVFFPIILVTLTRDLLGIDYPFNPEPIFYSILMLAFIFLGFFGIRNQDVFSNESNYTITPIHDVKQASTYEHSGLKNEIAESKHNELLSYMIHQKPYLEAKLSLSELAKKIDLSPNHLSQIINQYEEKNFNDFINSYRVDEFIRIATEKKHLSILAIAFDSGFNSKSTFNAVFKKHKGSTPSEYLAKVYDN